jgi:hypothetical protein
MGGAGDEHHSARRRHVRQHLAHQQEMRQVVDAERLLDPIGGESRAGDRHQPGVADHSAQRRQLMGEPANVGERSEVEATSGDVVAQPSGCVVHAGAAGDDDLPATVGEDRLRGVEAQASGAARDQCPALGTHAWPPVIVCSADTLLCCYGDYEITLKVKCRLAVPNAGTRGGPRWQSRASLRICGCALTQ